MVAPTLFIFLCDAMETTGIRQGLGKMHSDVTDTFSIVVIHGTLCHKINAHV